MFRPEHKGEIFVHGIRYPTTKPSLFTYNLRTHEVISQDRDRVYMDSLGFVLTDVLRHISDSRIIQYILETKDHIEHECGYYGGKIKSPQAWLQAFQDIYKERASMTVLSSGEPFDGDARLRGYSIANVSTQNASFLHSAGIPYSSHVLNRDVKYSLTTSLSEDQAKLFHALTDIEKLLCGQIIGSISIFDKAFTGKEEEVWFKGLTNFKEMRRYLRFSGMKDRDDFSGTYFHELAHILSNDVDGSRRFEEGLTVLLGKIAGHLIDKETQHQELLRKYESFQLLLSDLAKEMLFEQDIVSASKTPDDDEAP